MPEALTTTTTAPATLRAATLSAAAKYATAEGGLRTASANLAERVAEDLAPFTTAEGTQWPKGYASQVATTAKVGESRVRQLAGWGAARIDARAKGQPVPEEREYREAVKAARKAEGAAPTGRKARPKGGKAEGSEGAAESGEPTYRLTPEEAIRAACVAMRAAGRDPIPVLRAILADLQGAAVRKAEVDAGGTPKAARRAAAVAAPTA